MRKLSKVLSMLLVLALVFSFPVSTAKAAKGSTVSFPALEGDYITKYGNIYTDCPVETFVNEMGFSWGDIVTVEFLDQKLDLPVISTYALVDSGSPAILMAKGEDGQPTGNVYFAINMGNFAATYGLGTSAKSEDGVVTWTVNDGVKFPVEIKFSMKEEDGYANEMFIRDVKRTNNRADYAALTDKQFANFRAVSTTGMGKNILYRSSSPVNPEIARNTYADRAAKNAHVATFINLADDKATLEAYEGFENTYYSKQNIVALNLGVDFADKSFEAGLAKGLRFIAKNEGPYLVHCNEGKDRAGFVSAVLECLMGATRNEVVKDYMKTYANYYGVKKGTEQYKAIAESNILASLRKAFDVKNLKKADLAKEATEYLKGIGLKNKEIKALKAKLSADNNGYVEYTVSLKSDKYDIPATVVMPTKGEVVGAVVMLHGTGSNREEAGNGYQMSVPVLAQSGVASIRIDFAGNGDSKASYMEYTFESAVADAVKAAEYMSQLPALKGKKIGVMGWSQGGTDALLAAGQHPEVFSSVVTWAGAPDLSDMLTDDLYADAKKNGFFTMEFDWRDSLPVSLQWCEDVKNTDVLDVFKAYQGPVLAIAGTEDTTVDPEWSNKIVATNTNAASKTYFIEGMDHTFNVFSGDLTALYDAAGATADFFKATLR